MMSIQKENMKSKPKNGLKKVYSWDHPNSGSYSLITFFLLNVHLITKYLLPEKN